MAKKTVDVEVPHVEQDKYADYGDYVKAKKGEPKKEPKEEVVEEK